MSKVLIIADTHFDIRAGHPVFHDYFSKVFKHIFKYIDENQIKTIIQLGDTFDRRRQVNFLSLYKAQEQFFDPIKERGIKLYVIAGNHNCYYKTTNEVNSVRLLLQPDNISRIVYDTEPGTDSLGCGVDFDFFPWITEDNLESTKEFISKSKSRFAVGHFEFANFRISKTQMSESGMNHKLFSKYDLVFSGHYHSMSKKENILYCGTPYELDWNDCDDVKGVWCIDTANTDLEFIRTPITLFKKIIYDEQNQLPDVSDSGEKYVRLVVKNKSHQKQFDNFIAKILSYKPHDMQIIDQEISKSIQESLNSKVEFTTTTEMINCVVDSTETTLDKNKLKSIISETYAEATELAKL